MRSPGSVLSSSVILSAGTVFFALLALIIVAFGAGGGIDFHARLIGNWLTERLGQTIVVVTHDPAAAAYSDRVVFLADGRTVDEMLEPTADRVLERMKHFDMPGHPGA